MFRFMSPDRLDEIATQLTGIASEGTIPTATSRTYWNLQGEKVEAGRCLPVHYTEGTPVWGHHDH